MSDREDLAYAVGVIAGTWIGDWRATGWFLVGLTARALWRHRKVTPDG